jgi:outer membrane receptor protein involved in Fe transport
LLPKETLVLADGKRVAFGSLGVAGFSQAVDINLIPFPMIDHIDILKDGASAVYGSDAVCGVVNFFLLHKFRGLEIGGSYANTNLGASNEMGEWEAWIKAGTGDDKTDIVVIADFWERTGGLFSRDRDISSNAFQIPWGGSDPRSIYFPGRIGGFIGFRLTPKLFFSANSPVTTGVAFRGINDTGPRYENFTYWDQLFDVGLHGEMGEFGNYFRTWNWELGFRYSRNEGQNLSVNEASQPGLREALLDTNPATAFNPFLGSLGRNSNAARSRVYITLQNSGEFELPIGYVTINGDLFNLPAGPVSFAIGGEYRGERMTRDRDSLNQTFQSIGSVDGQGYRVNRDVWSIYQEIRVPFTSPTWNFSGFYSFEVDFAEREEWYSQNTCTVLVPFQPATSSQYNGQRPKISVRWQPIDPSISVRLPCVAATRKRFMRQRYSR